MAVAYALGALGGHGVIFVPETASPTKIEAIQAYGAEVRRQPGDPVLAETEARRHAEIHRLAYLSPYNDARVVGGQGTIGVELSRQLDRIDAVFIALGGGGLLSGIAGYLKSLDDSVEIVACSPSNSPVMHESVQAGRILERDSEPTLSDGTAGGVEQGAITLDLCRRFIDRSVLVSEEEIAEAMRLVIGRHHTLVEGAAGVVVAAYLQEQQRYVDKKVAIVLCGANIALDTLGEVLRG